MNRPGLQSSFWCLLIVILLLPYYGVYGFTAADSQTLRSLLQQPFIPSCEIDLIYLVTSVTEHGFSSKYDIAGNRDGDVFFHLEYEYVDPEHVSFVNATGVKVVVDSKCSSSKVCLQDDFKAGNNATFSTVSKFTPSPAKGSESLSIRQVQINGLECTQLTPTASDPLLEQSRCFNTMSFFSAFSRGSNRGSDVCRASFCCGYVLREHPPAVVAAQGPADDGVSEELPPVAEELLLLAADGSFGSAPDVTEDDGQQIISSSSSSTNTTINKGNEDMTPLVGAVAAVGVITILAAIAIIWWLYSSSRSAAPTDVGSDGSFDRDAVTLKHKVTLSPTISNASSTLTRSGSDTVSSPGAQSAISSDTNNSTVDDVVLYEVLGSGGFGTVYRGKWSGMEVAVKVLQTACGSSSKELKSFRKEIDVLSRLRHKNIISFYAACLTPPDICLVQELAKGGSLHDKLHGKPGERRRIPLPYGQLLKIGIDIAEAMNYLHTMTPRIVHRDLKAQNILLSEDGTAKVCDFGIARFKDRTFVSTVNGQSGTPQFMAPELFDGAAATEKVDVYSFGILLWEAFTGLVPWSNVPSPMQIIYYVGVLQQRPPMPKTIPAILKQLISDCWSDSPTDRPSFAQILDILKNEQKLVGDGQVDVAMVVPEGASGGDFEQYALHSYASSTSSSSSDGSTCPVEMSELA